MAMTMTIPNNSSTKRITVQIPTSSGDAVEAWVYLPEGSGPHPAVVMAHGIGGIKAGGLALLDRVGSLFGRQPIYIPGHGRPGDLSIGATPDGPFGEKLMTPKDGTPWHDRVAARSLLSFSWRRPVRRAASVRVPFLLVVPEADTIAPVPAALETARKAPGAELFRSVGGHYDVYEGGAGFADVIRPEADFLHRHAKTAAQKLS